MPAFLGTLILLKTWTEIFVLAKIKNNLKKEKKSVGLKCSNDKSISEMFTSKNGLPNITRLEAVITRN